MAKKISYHKMKTRKRKGRPAHSSDIIVCGDNVVFNENAINSIKQIFNTN